MDLKNPLAVMVVDVSQSYGYLINRYGCRSVLPLSFWVVCRYDKNTQQLWMWSCQLMQLWQTYREMKDRQRWQPEEDALLLAYVTQHGPKEWSLLPQRMGLSSFHRDPKSCLERWKNYLRPGLKKGSLTPEEQSLVISLQSKHGNKWNLIASHLPGRTPKRLGKWWEVFKEKQIKNSQKKKNHQQCYSMGETGSNSNTGTSVLRPQQGEYDHILDTFADKYVVKKGKMLPDLSLEAPVASFSPSMSMSSCNQSTAHGAAATVAAYSSYQNLLPRIPRQGLPPWMSTATTVVAATATGCNNNNNNNNNNNSNSPSVNLSLLPGENGGGGRTYVGLQQASTLCRELEEARQSLMHHKKEANWRLSRLEQQLESEKARKKREKEEEIKTKIRALREEEESCLDRLNAEYREQLSAIQRDAEAKEAKMMEMWSAKHAKLARLLGQLGSSASIDHHHRSPFQQQQQ